MDSEYFKLVREWFSKLVSLHQMGITKREGFVRKGEKSICK